LDKQNKRYEFFKVRLFSEFLKRKLNQGLSRDDHVQASDWLVPLRADQGFHPSDLKRTEWFRSEHTPSISDLLYAIGSRSYGQKRKEGRAHRKASTARIRRLWRSTPRWFQRFLRLADVTTTFRRKWRRRWCAGLEPLLPVTAERGGWRLGTRQ
jgi:hypothetical protein